MVASFGETSVGLFAVTDCHWVRLAHGADFVQGDAIDSLAVTDCHWVRLARGADFVQGDAIDSLAVTDCHWVRLAHDADFFGETDELSKSEFTLMSARREDCDAMDRVNERWPSLDTIENGHARVPGISLLKHQPKSPIKVRQGFLF